MRSPPIRLAALAGITCAMLGASPVALADNTTPTPLPGQSCSENQGLLPGIPNLGPTGPLGPLGSKGPLGGDNSKLPCGAAAFDLGPGGPLVPGGALGSISSPAPRIKPAPPVTPARLGNPA